MWRDHVEKQRPQTASEKLGPDAVATGAGKKGEWDPGPHPDSGHSGKSRLFWSRSRADPALHAGFPRGEHRGSQHRFLLAPSPLLIATGEAIPLRGLEGVPGLPGAPQDEAGLTRKFETSHVGGATGRTPPIPRSALEKDPRPGPLFEGNPVGEGTTRRATATTVHRPQRPAGSTHSSTRGLRPPVHPVAGCLSLLAPRIHLTAKTHLQYVSHTCPLPPPP